MEDQKFYSRLPVVRLPIHQVFKKNLLTQVPGSWHVVVTDVKNSTEAVKEGRHNDVNLVAASSLIVALNLGKQAGIEIPFFFTGDGGTVIIPDLLLEQVINGLNLHNQNSILNFNLVLHLGHITVQELRDAGHELNIAKVEFSTNFIKPVISGNGLKYAEQVIKAPSVRTETTPEPLFDLNMEGLECRWDKIKPPSVNGEIVCYIIEAVDASSQNQVFADTLQKINEIYGEPAQRNPLSIKRLKLMLSATKIKKEMLAKYGRWRSGYFAKSLLETIAGFFYFAFNFKVNLLKGQDYLAQVMNNADTLTIDGKINTVITGMPEKRILFLEYLDIQEGKGLLHFGHHISTESIMTCYIENRQDKHIHFVDGGDGGYTEASKELKRKTGL